MAMPRLSLRCARQFMENAFLDLLDILAWQEGVAPDATILHHRHLDERHRAETGRPAPGPPAGMA